MEDNRCSVQQNIPTRNWLHWSSRVDASGSEEAERTLGVLLKLKKVDWLVKIDEISINGHQKKCQGCVFGSFYTHNVSPLNILSGEFFSNKAIKRVY